MRRLLSILLLLAFGLPVVAPLLAQGDGIEQRLPICCRRTGAHHCTMGHDSRTNTPTLSARCPSFPQQSTTAPHLTFAALLTTQPAIKLPGATQSAPQRAETQRRISRERTRQTRGPPAAATLAA